MSWTILSFVSGALTALKLNQLYDNEVHIARGLGIYASDTGIANAYAVALTPAPTTYTAGLCVRFKAANGNTGASTLNVNSLGAKTIKRYDFTILAANDIVAGRMLDLVYDGTDFILLNPAIMVTVQRGYGMGGCISTGSKSAEIDGIQFSDESAINPSAALSVARQDLCGVNSGMRGYAMGGDTGTLSTEIDGIQFSDESAVNPSAALNTARYGVCGVNSATRGYAMTGWTGSTSAEIDGIQFSDESAINPSAALNTARYHPCGVNSAMRGYAMGGNGPSAEIDGIQFSDESAINPSAALAIARYYPCGVNSSAYGYAMGGDSGAAPKNDIDGIQFSNESAIDPSATLSSSRAAPFGTNSIIRGYAMGGSTTALAGGVVTEIDGIQFSDNSAINPSAVLSVARFRGGCGVQSGGIL